MKEYTEYNPYNGEILATGVTQDDVFDSMTNVIEGRYDEAKYYIYSGKPFEYPEKPTKFHTWNLQGRMWEFPQWALSDARSARATLLDSDCKKEIVSGFISSALGLGYHYPSKETDQANLNSSVTASMYPGLPQDWTTPFWCERDGQWRYRLHTAAQIQRVGFDGKNAVLSFLAKNASLQEQLANAQTIEDIMAVQW